MSSNFWEQLDEVVKPVQTCLRWSATAGWFAAASARKCSKASLLAASSIAAKVDRRDKVDLSKVLPPEWATETRPTSTAAAAAGREVRRSSHLSENQVEPWWGSRERESRWPRSRRSRRRSRRRPATAARPSSRPCSGGPSPWCAALKTWKKVPQVDSFVLALHWAIHLWCKCHIMGSSCSTALEHTPVLEQNSWGCGFDSQWVLGFFLLFLSLNSVSLIRSLK